MNEKYSALFTPWKIGNVEIKNRIVQPSMGGTSLFGWLEPCHFDKEAAYHILNRAQNNVGLVLPGMQCVRDTMGGRWLYQNKKMFKDLAEWLPEFHKTGSKLFVQLSAGMGRSMAINEIMVKMLQNKAFGAVGKPFLNVDYITASASATPNRWYPECKSRPLTVEEIHEMVDAFAKTAKLLQDAGVDGVEIHAVHEGYLLDQFTIANMNYRTDEYGGSFENRYRFAVEIVQAIKAVCGKDFPVALRYSVVSKTKGFGQGAVPGEEFVEFGRDMAESEKAIKYLGDAGYDMFNCDNGTYDAWYWAHPPQYMPDNCNLEYVEHIKKFTNCPVVCAGRMDPVKAAEEIAAGRLDAVAIARQNLVDHEWVHKILSGHEDEIKPCIRCHNGCFNFAKFKGTANIQSTQDSLHLGRCALNPTTMQHNKYKIVPTKSPKKVAIIGAGIGGLMAAEYLKARGHNPTVYEATDAPGGHFVLAGKAPKKQAFTDAVMWDAEECKRMGIEIKTGVTVTPELIKEVKPDHVIVATGAHFVAPNIPGLDTAKDVYVAEDVLAGKAMPHGETIILGGGGVGCETAQFLIAHGVTDVRVMDTKRVGNKMGMLRTMFLDIEYPGETIKKSRGSKVTAVGDHEITYAFTNKAKKTVEKTRHFDSLVIATGMHSRPTQDLTDACSELGIPCDVIGSARKADMGIEATAEAYAAAMKV